MLKGVFQVPGVRVWISGLLFWVLLSVPAMGQQITSIAGNGTFGFSGDGGVATSATIADPLGVYVDSLGNVFIADTNNRRIRKIDTLGVMTTVAGNGNFGFSGDGGQATSASLADPSGVFVDPSGNIYIADTNNQRIRKIDTGGVITTIAGDGIAGFAGDGGQATSARLNFPTGVFVDQVGNLFFADRENHRIRKVDTSGIISTVAGNGAFGSSGDGGQATSANLAFPSGVFVDVSGNIYIADRFNYKVRMVDTSGVITTVAGNGAFGFSGDGGQATSANLAFPSAVYVNSNGDLYIADRDNHRIRRVDTTGVITTVAGNGTPTFSGDGGGAIDASLNRPSSVWGDSLGALWVADTNNRRVRKVYAPTYVSTPVGMLNGVTSAQPGDEVNVFSIGLIGSGTDTLSQIQITVSDLSSSTGMVSGDLAELRLYESNDAVLDGGDTLVGTLQSVPIGSVSSIVPSATVVPPPGSERFYLISAVLSAQAIDGHAFKVSFSSQSVSLTSGGFGNTVGASDANRVVTDIEATQLVFSSHPAGSVSGLVLGAQPVVVAQNDSGLVDLDFAEVITLSISTGSGSLFNASVSAVNGVATFTNVTYTASSDGESVVLSANDQDGVGTNLSAVLSNVFTSDVLATQMVFSTQPSGVVSGQALTTQPVVTAVNDSGQVDTDFVDVVILSEDGAGSLSNGSVQAVNGVATFTNVSYATDADGETFSLTADDEVGGSGGDLTPIVSSSLTSDITATQLVFSTQPSGSVSGLSLGSQPVVTALDDSGRVDTDFTEVITLSISTGSGSLFNASVSAVNGVATFTNVAYTASSDGESVVLSANDQDGVDTNLSAVLSNVFTSDVLATQMVFSTQPSGVVSGQALTTQPVVTAVNDSGQVDTDFVDVVILSEDGAGSLSNGSVQAVNGVATFTNVSYATDADGETFSLTADDEVGGSGGDLTPIVSSSLTSDITATQLVFSTQPSGSVSGLSLGSQPVVTALDDSGRVDTDFTEVITLSISTGSGSLFNASVSAVNGVATFTNVAYTASSDGESVVLSANDQDGVDTNLSAVLSNVFISDVLATQMVFSTQPSGVVSGQALTTQPVVSAVNDSGQVDTDFVDIVTLSEDGAGSLSNGSVQAVNGVATFVNIIYVANADREGVTFTANDESGGNEGDLSPILSNLLTANVLATQLIFTAQPAGSVSGQPLSTQPIVIATDDSGRVDLDFTDTITLESNVGDLTNNQVQAVDGIATFTNLTFDATLDNQTFTVTANDEAGGAEGDLNSVVAPGVQSNVVATRLLFLVQPNGSVNGQPLTSQPVVVAVDSQDVIDIDFVNPVTLTVDGAGSVTNATLNAISGITTFTQVTYITGGQVGAFRLLASSSGLVDALSDSIQTQVIAKQLVFSTQPAGSVSGQPLLVQPVVEARDSLGQIDTNFSDTISLTVQGAGEITELTAVSVNGRAIFQSLAYLATSDEEGFALIANDESGGIEGDLAPVTSNTIMSNVVATRLELGTHPAQSVSGRPLLIQPRVLALDSLGVLDTGFTENIVVTSSGAGVLSGSVQQMQNGVVDFSSLVYAATSDGESFELTFDDELGGLDLMPIVSDTLICNVVATRLVYAVQPQGARSGQPLLVQPEIEAVDSLGVRDLDFAEAITITTQASGSLTNAIVQTTNGFGQANGLTFTANQDRLSLVFVANDAVGLPDVASAQSDTLICDVVANQLIFATQPVGSNNGNTLAVQPVVRAEFEGVVDTDFNDVVSLTHDGQGTLIGESVVAASGVATFIGVKYVASEDRELVRLVADDTAAGVEGDLVSQNSQTFQTEVTASRLEFEVMASGIISSLPFLTQPVVVAIDSFGIVDKDVTDTITLSTNSQGLLSNNTIQAQNGIAAFDSVSYTATAGLETFVLQADDTVAGGDLLPAHSDVLTAGAGVAHHLGIYLGQTGLVADGESQRNVVVRVLDENNNPLLHDNVTRISLLVQGAASGGGSQVADNGEVAFPVVSQTKTGMVYLQVSAEGLIGAVDSFRTLAGDAVSLAIVVDRSPLLANGTSSKDVKLQLLDQYGNLRTQDNSTLVALGVSGASAQGGGTTSVKGGEASFVVRAGTETGVIQLRANAGGLPEETLGIIVGAVMPDLVVSQAPVGPDVIFRNGAHSVTLQVKNTGLDSVRNAFDVEILLVGGGDSIGVGRSVISGSLAPDSAKVLTIPFSVPSFSFATLASDYHWVGRVDGGGFVTEEDETNNLARGNLVSFPELSVSVSAVDFQTVVPDSTFEQTILVENRGRAELRFQVISSDTQLGVVAPVDSFFVMDAGASRLVRVFLTPTQTGKFQGQLHFSSNDPKGDTFLDVQARVAAPDRVFIDLDSTVGNQGVTQVASGREKTIEVSLFVGNLPDLQAVSVDLLYDADLLEFETGSWNVGGYFLGGGAIIDEVVVAQGLVRLSGGSVGDLGVDITQAFGSLRFKTPLTLPTDAGRIVAGIEAVQIKYLDAAGNRDSLQVQGQAQIVFDTEANWPDLDGDGQVTFADFLIFVNAFKQDESSMGWAVELVEKPFPFTPYKRFDIDGDGQVGFFDFVTYAQDFKNAQAQQ